MPYQIFVADNAQYIAPATRSALGEFPSLATALAAAQQIVDAYLLAAYRPGMTAQALVASYTTFGEDPFIVDSAGQAPGVLFSAWDYARQRAAAMCPPA